jgi:VWFA-related protein
MHKLFYLVAVVLTLAVAVFSQTPSPTPSPKASDEVVRISTNLVQVDVTVTDKSGKIVRGLKPEDFEIYENGQREPISNFSFINNARETTAAPEKTSEKQQVVLPPTPIRPEQVRRTIALVVDDLSLSFESTYYARRALKKFVDEQMQDGDLVAIIRTGGGVGALQQFTTDKRQLYAAIEKVRWNPVGTGNVSAFAPMEAKVDLGPTPTPQPGERTAEGIQKEQDSFRASIFATGTLGAINYVVRGMQELPGRKSVMLISDGFKLYEDDAEGFKESGRVLQALRQLVDAANRASVVIYTMDARGLVYTGLTAADNTSGRSSDDVEKELSDRRDQLFDTQDGLHYLAKQTGGLSIINSNDLSGGIRKILDDQSYYLIGYVPESDTFDPKLNRFNKLIVKVKQPGLTVRYRSGFFGISDDKNKALAEAAGPTGRNKLFSALTSPFAVGQIPLRMNALFNTGQDGIVYVRTLLHIDISQIKFQEQPDKSEKADIEILVVAYGDNGQIIDQSGKAFSLSFPRDVYEKFLREGLVNIYTFPVKKPGAYQLRLAIRDTATDKVGSANQFIEIPNLKKDRLALSSVVLEDLPYAEYQRLNSTGAAATSATTYTDSSLRQFKTGTVLTYGFSIFNPRPGSAAGGDLEWQLKLYRDGKLMFDGKPQKVAGEQTRPNVLEAAGSLMLGTETGPGDYVLQITATDKLAPPKKNSATQFVQFEIVN